MSVVEDAQCEIYGYPLECVSGLGQNDGVFWFIEHTLAREFLAIDECSFRRVEVGDGDWCANMRAGLECILVSHDGLSMVERRHIHTPSRGFTLATSTDICLRETERLLLPWQT